MWAAYEWHVSECELHVSGMWAARELHDFLFLWCPCGVHGRCMWQYVVCMWQYVGWHLQYQQLSDHWHVMPGALGSISQWLLAFCNKTWVRANLALGWQERCHSRTHMLWPQVLYGESPANPTMSIVDLEAFGALGKSLPGVVSMVDCTFASPFLVQPIKYGVDISIHSWWEWVSRLALGI